MKVYCLNVLITVLAVTAIASSAQALTACQDGCNGQYYTTVELLWQTQRPATTAPTTYRQQVLVALSTLNQCMAACSTSSAEQPPTAPVPTDPTPPRGKKP